MYFTVSTAFTLLACAARLVTATSGNNVVRSVQELDKRFDPATQAQGKIALFDSTNGASAGYLYVFENTLRYTADSPGTFQYTRPSQSGGKVDIEFPEQGGAFSRQVIVATKDTATAGVHSPTASGDTKSDLFTLALPIRSPAGSTPTLDNTYGTWYESAIWSIADDGTISCTWINPDGSSVPLYPFLVVEALHFSPNPAKLYPWGGPWFDMKTLTLKFVQ
ncbi:hypothetical protein CPB86DRAFT_784730 [Serendipita vermifera]|nr:hypothetical protein CPB86DRAFT_784730 [Serendipita vermifera]